MSILRLWFVLWIRNIWNFAWESRNHICGQQMPRLICAFMQSRLLSLFACGRIYRSIQKTLDRSVAVRRLSWVNLKYVYKTVKDSVQCPSFTLLTHLCLASHKWDIGKQCRLRLDAAERGVWSGSTLFALTTGLSIKHGNNQNWPDTP